MRITIPRQNVVPTLDRLVASGRTFSVFCGRRNDLCLRYSPTDQYKNGRLCYEGDCSDVASRQLQSVGRGGNKIVAAAKGTMRWMQLTKKSGTPTKHWQPVPGGKLNYDPAVKRLYLVKGFYNDLKKSDGRIARHGQWRPWAQICLDTIALIRADGDEYVVN